MVLPPGARIQSDAYATGGAVVRFTTTGVARRQSIIPTATTVRVRAKANWCNGWPYMTLKVDGRGVLTRQVKSTTLTPYTATAAIAPGSHAISVQMGADSNTGTCNRMLVVDMVAFESPEAINTATPGSRCEASDEGYGYTNPTAGTSTTALGSYPAYYEVTEPTTGPAVGTMIILHGGGWFATGPGPVAAVRHVADEWVARGWRTVNASYGACAQSVPDVLTLYDLVASRYSDSPICALGQSAGGHLSLMMAAKRDLACVISEGGPTSLVDLGAEDVYGGATGTQVATWRPRRSDRRISPP